MPFGQKNKLYLHMKITEKGLKGLGFKLAKDKGITGRNLWRLKVPYYPYQIQMELGDYDSSNPNCGILSLYEPPTKAVMFKSNGKKKKLKLEEFCRPIAWHVDTHNRLYNIIQSLTQVNL